MSPPRLKQVRRVTHNIAGDELGPVLCPRTTSAKILGVSVPTIRRLEQAGLLDLIRLDPNKPTGRALNRVAQVRALAEGESN